MSLSEQISGPKREEQTGEKFSVRAFIASHKIQLALSNQRG
jgi:hypothetical protein